MLNFDEIEDIFFDSADYLPSEEPVVMNEDSYGIWMSEPQSIRERRESFLQKMGFIFVESSSKQETVFGTSVGTVGLERIMECSGAVLNSSSSINDGEEKLTYCSREGNGEANFLVDDLEHDKLDKTNIAFEMGTTGDSTPDGCKQKQDHLEDCKGLDMGGKDIRGWWQRLVKKRSVLNGLNAKTHKTNRMKVRHNKKSCMELTGLYSGQEIHGHDGYIWTMKFSPDGQYLASGGEDGIVRIWRVTLADASYKNLMADFCSRVNQEKSSSQRKKLSHASIIIPDKVFQIEESHLQEFHGHTSDVLDLDWSNNNCLLSSSKDKTVRLWQLGCSECLNVFRHNNYVTCIQFDPVDNNYFISGSIDGKVRIWGVSEQRVVDWADVRDVVTAVCYQPHGKGFVVGSVTGTCRFYEPSGSHMQLNAQIHIQGRRRTSGNKITGIQFSPKEPQRVMITSEDSGVRIFDGIDLVLKYKGLRNSGQMSASFTSTTKHIISVGEDSRVYVWNYEGSSIHTSRHTKSVRSCEHFFFEGVSVAIPWSSMQTEEKDSGSGSGSGSGSCDPHCLQPFGYVGAGSCIRDSERFALGNWFSVDGPCRRSATWPEEKLPHWGLPVAELDHHQSQDHQHELQHLHHQTNIHNYTTQSETWGLVIVTASWDGTIRTFHNYGLPIKL
ncbi:WD repeat-containing protein YMR102C [Malania oleifera]|uniref:WD repeat-containing protein YMR102C n=1 Tax=Malania oleifera TaxID=397392 RepID=UPI0025ADCB1A|nr:WD repeat-containing protein YMR102C [Malania oleifera]